MADHTDPPDRTDPSDGAAGREATGEPVGSLAEEATKLWQALQDWTKDGSGDVAGAAASAAAGASSTTRRIHEHLATDSPDCRYCPVCQVISAVRGISPEVREHLASAATSLGHAAATLLATPVPTDRGRPDTTSEQIDLSDDAEEDD